MFTMKNHKKEEATLADRFALGFAGAITTFITGTIVWIGLNSLFFSATETITFPFYIVLLFTAFGTVLGILTLENHLLRILAPIWNLLASVIGNIR